MKLDEEFEPSADEYSLPDKLMDKLEACWKGLRHIVVERRSRRTWKKVNGFDVSIEVKGQTDDDPEEVATMIVAIAATDVENEGEEGTYRARFIRSNEGKESRRQSYTFKQGFGEHTTDAFEDGEPNWMHMMGTMVNQNNHLISVLTTHNENLVGRIIEHDQVSCKQIELLTKTNEVMAGQFHQGLSMQASAMAQILDVERSLEADRQRGQNNAALFKMLDKALPKALTQWGLYLRKQAGKKDADKDEDEDEDEDEDGDDEKEGDEGEDKKPSEDETEEQREQRILREKLKKRPLTTFAHAFKDSLTTDQALGLADILSKAQRAALKEATTAKEDEATATGILKLYELIMKKPEKLEELSAILDERQVAMILKLNEKAEEFAEKQKENADKKDKPEKPN